MTILPDPSGLAEGITQTGNVLGNVLKQIVAQRAGGLTPYQQISTFQRAKEQQGKTERGVLNALNQFADIEGFLTKQQIPFVYKDILSRIRQGQNAADALNAGVQDFRDQQNMMDELAIEKYNQRRGEELKESIIEKFRSNNIRNPNLIETALKKKKWPARERKNITLKMQGIEEPLKVKKPKKTLSQEELKARFDKVPGKTREQKIKNFKKILESEGYSVTGV